MSLLDSQQVLSAENYRVQKQVDLVKDKQSISADFAKKHEQL